MIDPADLEVVGAGGTGAIAGGTNAPTTASTIDAGTIVTALNGTNVNLQATNSITVNAAINASGNASGGNLTLTAPTANLNQPIALKTGSTLSGTATTVNVGATGTVQNGVDVSAAGGTVNLAAATYRLAQEVGINKNVTVRGAGAGTTTVSGNNAVRVFNIGSGTVTLDGMSIVNGTTGSGGGILNYGTLTVSNSTLFGNSAQSYGGGIYNYGTLTIGNSTLSGNSAQYGGGIFNNNYGTLTIDNSTLSGNSAQYYGGGILNNYGGTLTIGNSTLSGNSSDTGGGIFNYNGTLTIGNSTLSGNSAQYYGGGIYNSGGTVTIGNSTLSGNSAQNGGGIFNNNYGTVTIGNSIVSGNTAPSGREIQNLSTCLSQGYNLFGYSGSNGLSGMTNTIANDITPTAALSGILAPLGNYGGPTQTHALVLNSPALNAGNPTITTDQRGGQRGSAGLNAGSRIDIGAYEATSSILVTNTLDTNATGTLRNAIGFVNTNINPLNTTSPTDIRFNIGTVGSAQTIALTSALPAIVKSTTIDGSTQGGTGYNVVPLITVSGSNLFRVFEVGSGTTVGMNGLSIVNGNKAGNDGGGIFNLGTLTVNNSTLSGNNAVNYGGGIFSQGTLTVNNSTLSGNTSNYNGGGIYSEGTVTVNNSTLSENKSRSVGGGIYSSGTGTVNNSTLSGNNIDNGGGGGIFSQGTLTVNNSTLSGNNAYYFGGGIFSQGTLTLNSSIVSGNTAPVAREISNGGSYVTSSGYNLFGYSGNNGLSGITPVATDITPSAALSEILAPLGNYGGPTKTHALLPGSAAINAGNAASNTLDQRGKARVGTADIGAFESQGFTFATTAGTPQNITVGQAAATPLTVKVTANNAIEPVAGGIVTFTAPNTTTAASLATAVNGATINASGTASLSATANTKAGTYNVLATANGVTPTQTFALTNLADVAKNIATTSGSGQNTTVDTNFANNLVATVTDKFGNPVSNSTVTFSVPGTNASGVFVTNTANTDVNGVATIAIKANTKAGSFTTTGKVGGVTTGADFNLTNTADIANTIVANSGSGQTTTVDQNFANNLIATVTDKFGNPIAGSTVTFSVPGSGASGVFGSNTAVTDVTGTATIGIKANTKSGGFTAKGGVTGVTGTADYALTNLADVAKNIVTTSGSGQSTVVDTNFANNLVATVTDQFGNPVSNSTVTFSVPGTNASGVFVTNTANTDVNGVATIVIKANTKAGSFTTTGKVGGVTTGADFNLTNIADVANAIVANSGSGQTTTVDQNFANLVATVTDKFGNPVQGSTVTFSLPGSGASGVFGSNTAVTDATGTATIGIKANTKPGTYTVKASVIGITGTADFALTNKADQPTPITNEPKTGPKTDRTLNLEAKEIRTLRPTIVLTKPILCVVRERGASLSDDYRGLSSCGDSNQKKASKPKKSEQNRRDR